MMGLVHLALLESTAYQSALIDGQINAGLADVLWREGVDVARSYAKFAAEFDETILGVIADGRHQLFNVASERGFAEFSPRGLLQTSQTLPGAFPRDEPDSSMAKALKMLIEDELAFASQEYQEFWRILMRTAQDHPIVRAEKS